MLKLRRLKVDKFRSLARGAELRFSDGINVLLGQNGTGKTTLLELISMVVRSDFSSLAKEEFAVEYELAVDEGESLVVRVRNERQPAEPLPEPFTRGARDVYRSWVEVLGGLDGRSLLVLDPALGLIRDGEPRLAATATPAGVEPSFLWRLIAGVPPFSKQFPYRLLEAVVAERFDESLNLFRRITEEDALADLLVLSPGMLRAEFDAKPLIPDDLVKGMSQDYQPSTRDYSFTHERFQFLARLKDMMEFSSAELGVRVTESHPVPGGVTFVHLGKVVFRFAWKNGGFIEHDRLSYGQKRLLAFFYYLACNTDIVIADELVNGLHHRWITASIEAIGQRQAFLTSQNPLLLDYIPFPSADAVGKSFVLCSSEPREDRPAWIWENMSQEDARELFSAYEVGVEHVSEILQSRGLW